MPRPSDETTAYNICAGGLLCFACLGQLMDGWMGPGIVFLFYFPGILKSSVLEFPPLLTYTSLSLFWGGVGGVDISIPAPLENLYIYIYIAVRMIFFERDVRTGECTYVRIMNRIELNRIEYSCCMVRSFVRSFGNGKGGEESKDLTSLPSFLPS